MRVVYAVFLALAVAFQEDGGICFVEFYELNRLGEFLTKSQRRRILEVVKLMFPKAVRREYTIE